MARPALLRRAGEGLPMAVWSNCATRRRIRVSIEGGDLGEGVREVVEADYGALTRAAGGGVTIELTGRVAASVGRAAPPGGGRGMLSEHYRRVAREAAERLVEVLEEPSDPDRRWLVWFRLGGRVERRGTAAAALKAAEPERGVLTRFLTDALERMLLAPLPGGLSHRELAEVLLELQSLRASSHLDVQKALDGADRLAGQVEHLARLLHDCEEGALGRWCESWRAAFEAGAKAQRKLLDGYDGPPRDAPLATPEGEGEG